MPRRRSGRRERERTDLVATGRAAGRPGPADLAAGAARSLERGREPAEDGMARRVLTSDRQGAGDPRIAERPQRGHQAIVDDALERAARRTGRRAALRSAARRVRRRHRRRSVAQVDARRAPRSGLRPWRTLPRRPPRFPPSRSAWQPGWATSRRSRAGASPGGARSTVRHTGDSRTAVRAGRTIP